MIVKKKAETKAEKKRKTEEQKKVEKRAKDVISRREKRKVMSNDHQIEIREKNTASRRQKRSLLPDDDQAEIREKNTAGRSQKRDLLSDDEQAEIRKKDTAARIQSRIAKSPDGNRLETQKRMSALRECRTPEERQSERDHHASAFLESVQKLSTSDRQSLYNAHNERVAVEVDKYIQEIKEAEATVTLHMKTWPKPEAFLHFDRCNTPEKAAIIPLMLWYEMCGTAYIPLSNDINRLDHEMEKKSTPAEVEGNKLSFHFSI